MNTLHFPPQHRRHSDHLAARLNSLLVVLAIVTWTMLSYVVYDEVRAKANTTSELAHAIG